MRHFNKSIYVIPLIVVALTLPFFSQAQQKHDTKVIVVANDTAQLFKRVALYLLDKGYTIESKYDDLQSLTTGAHKWTGMTAATYKIGAQVKDSTIILTGQLRLEVAIMGTQPTNYDPVDYRTNSMHMNRRVWEWMEEIAKNFGQRITYAK